MRNHPRWSRIFAACAVLTVLVGVASMFFVVQLSEHVGIGYGCFIATTPNVSFYPANVGWIRTSDAWHERLRLSLVPYLSWDFVRIPLWMPALIFAALAWFTRSRTKPPNHCRNCGYSLTGNTSGVCPECGEKTPGSDRCA